MNDNIESMIVRTKFKKMRGSKIREGSGALYLTSGGRIVLDCGWGETFNDTDTMLFTLDELHKGMQVTTFLNLISNKAILGQKR